MSAGENQHSHNEDVRFESTDVATKPVVVSVVALALFTIVFTFVAHFVYFRLAERQREASAPASPLAAQYAAKEPPAPRLQIDPKKDLVELHAAEDRILLGYGWADKEKGIARIPVERAMEMLLAKGLPARQAPVPWKMAPTGVAPSQPAEAAGAPDWYERGAGGQGGYIQHAGPAGHGAEQAHGGATAGTPHGSAAAPAHPGPHGEAHGH